MGSRSARCDPRFRWFGLFAVAMVGCTQAPQPAPGFVDAASTATDADASQPAAEVTAVADSSVAKACQGPADCPGGFCQDSACVACRAASDCTGVDACVAGQCVPRIACQSDKACTGVGQVCWKSGGFCVDCNADDECPSGKTCKAHGCVDPPSACKNSKDCAPSLVCDKAASACVECTEDGDCPGWASCQESRCVPDECVAKSSNCQDSTTARVCAGNGSAWQVQACSGGATCHEGLCTQPACQSGTTSCSGDVVQTCNAQGTGAQATKDCKAQDPAQICVDGACVPSGCQAGATQCKSGTVALTCGPSGTWQEASCPPSQTCAGGGCKPWICQPNSPGCDGSQARTCAADGLGWVAGVDCAQSGQACVTGKCASASVCTAGSKQCAGGTVQVCAADGGSWTTQSCDDGQACTTDGCSSGACTHVSAADGTPCTATGACTVGGSCSGGQCQGGTSLFAKMIDPGFGAGSAAVYLTRLLGGDWGAAYDVRHARLDAAGNVKWAASTSGGAASPVLSLLPDQFVVFQGKDKQTILGDFGLTVGSWATPGLELTTAIQFDDALVACGSASDAKAPSLLVFSLDGKLKNFKNLPAFMTCSSLRGAVGGQILIGMSQSGNDDWAYKTDQGLADFVELSKVEFDFGLSFIYNDYTLSAAGVGYIVGQQQDDKGKASAMVWKMVPSKIATPLVNLGALGLKNCSRVLALGDGDLIATCTSDTASYLLRFAPEGEVRWMRPAGSFTIGSQAGPWHKEAMVSIGQGGALLSAAKIGKDSGMALGVFDAFGNFTCQESGACAGKKATDCDDGNPCTNDLCNATSGCTHEPFPNGLPCGPPDKICKNSVCF